MDNWYYERKVAYYETDGMGIVHHSNYIRWLEEARLCAMESLNISYAEMERTGILIPVLTASCEYRVSFRYGDTFRVKLRPVTFNGIKMSLAYEVVDPENVLHATGETSHCFLNKEMRPVSLKKTCPDIYQILKDWAS